MAEETKQKTLVQAFLAHLQHEKRYSSKTIVAYKADLRQFTVFIARAFQQNEPEKISYREIRKWIIELMKVGLEARSVNRKIVCLRSFYKFCMKKEVIKEHPMTKIKMLKIPQKLPHVVSEENMIQMLDQFPFNDDFEGTRDRLILELLYGTGIRQSELINLKETQINRWENTIRVLGKRQKERIIPFPKALIAILDSYIVKKKQATENQGHDLLFVTAQGNPLYPMIVYRIVRKYLTLFSTVEKKSPHVLRHTFATHLLNKGAEINAVKDLLGHSSLASTQVYTHNSIEKLKKVFDQAHPKAK